MNRKVILGGLCAVIFIVLMIVLSLSLVKKPTTIAQARAVANTMNTATAYTNNSYVYDNNQEFIEYNYTTGKTTQLTPSESQVNSLSNCDSLSVSANHQYILFHNEYAAAGSILSSTLQNDGLNTSLDYWWVYDVASKTFTPLPQGILIAKMSDNTVYALSPNDSITETITSYNPATGTKIGSLNVALASNFFVVNGGYLLETAKNNVLFTKNGVVSTQLFTDTNIIGVTTNGDWAVATTGQNSAHPLIRINLQNDKTNVPVLAGVTGPTAWLNSGLVLFTTGNPTINANALNFETYNANTNTVATWNLPPKYSTNPTNPPLTAVTIFSPDTALISDSQNNYYLIGNALAAQ